MIKTTQNASNSQDKYKIADISTLKLAIQSYFNHPNFIINQVNLKRMQSWWKDRFSTFQKYRVPIIVDAQAFKIMCFEDAIIVWKIGRKFIIIN